MLFKIISFTTVLIFSIMAGACGGDTGPANSTNTAKSVNANANAANSDPLATTKKTETATSNNAPTLTPVVHAYYEALKKKDDAGVRAVMSKEWLAAIEEDLRLEKRKDLAGYMAEYDIIPDKPVEVRNERIEGNDAVAEIRGGAYPNWTPFGFVLEDGVWKFTGGSADLDAVKKTAPSAR